jgi:hypothetical protein
MLTINRHWKATMPTESFLEFGWQLVKEHGCKLTLVYGIVGGDPDLPKKF